MTSDAWLSPERGGTRTDVEGSVGVDVGSDLAEESADSAQGEIAEFVEMQSRTEPPD